MTSKLEKDIVESVKEGLHSIGKNTRFVDKSITQRVILTSILNNKLWKKGQNIFNVISYWVQSKDDITLSKKEKQFE